MSKMKESKSASNLATGIILLVVAVFLVSWIDCDDSPRPHSPRTSAKERPDKVVDTKPKLLLLSWRWHNEHGFAIAEGEVQNVSSENLRNVMAVVTWYTADKKFITSDEALIDFNPIIPGQTSPFSVMATYNPAMRNANITFKELMGGTIRWKKKE